MKKKLHWLSPGKNSDCVDTLLNSNLASTRLRTAVAYQSLTNNNYRYGRARVFPACVELFWL